MARQQTHLPRAVRRRSKSHGPCTSRPPRGGGPPAPDPPTARVLVVEIGDPDVYGSRAQRGTRADAPEYTCENIVREAGLRRDATRWDVRRCARRVLRAGAASHEGCFDAAPDETRRTSDLPA